MNRLPESVRQTVVEHLRQGRGTNEVVRLTGLSNNTVAKIRKGMGLAANVQAWRPEGFDRSAAASPYAMSNAQIAEALGISASEVSRLANSAMRKLAPIMHAYLDGPNRNAIPHRAEGRDCPLVDDDG